MYVTRDEVLMGRDKAEPLTPELEQNLKTLLLRLNQFRDHYGAPLLVSSGYRPASINAATPGAAKKSNHMKCLACDFKDADGSLAKWCLLHLGILEACSLWMEAPAHTPGWVHLQCVPPASGHRVFVP